MHSISGHFEAWVGNRRPPRHPDPSDPGRTDLWRCPPGRRAPAPPGRNGHRAGQDAAIKLETFPFTRYGTVKTTVHKVTQDAVNDEKRGALFPVTLKLAPGMGGFKSGMQHLPTCKVLRCQPPPRTITGSSPKTV